MIVFTQGDSAVLNLTATDGATGNPIDITGASIVTQIKGTDGKSVSFPAGQHSVTNGPLGKFTLTLSTSDTAKCGLGDHKEIVSTVTVGGQVVAYHGVGILQVLASAPKE